MARTSTCLLLAHLLAMFSASLTNSQESNPKNSSEILLQKTRDEFNSTLTFEGEATTFAALNEELERINPSGPGQANNKNKSPALKKFLLQLKLDECCPSWTELTQLSGIQDEQRRLFGKARAQMKPEDLLGQLGRVFVNISRFAIDGQPGQSEWQKYYKFYDNVRYYLRLEKVCANYLADLEAPREANSTSSIWWRKRQVGSKTSFDESLASRTSRSQFERVLASIQFRLSQDPLVSSFIEELQLGDENFESYENFIRFTHFGQLYARNISMVRESLQVLEIIGSHLENLSFPSNLTRPSKVYQMIREMSHELFRVRHELVVSVSDRILTHREDVKRTFRQMDELVESRPDIKMLGDEFNSDPLDSTIKFGEFVRELTRLLDLYTTNNMTHLSFYNQLSSLPEDFIMLGLVVAREYESKELPQYSRFDADFYNWEYSSRVAQDRTRSSLNTSEHLSSSDSARSHQGDRSLLSRVLFGR